MLADLLIKPAIYLVPDHARGVDTAIKALAGLDDGDGPSRWWLEYLAQGVLFVQTAAPLWGLATGRFAEVRAQGE